MTDTSFSNTSFFADTTISNGIEGTVGYKTQYGWGSGSSPQDMYFPNYNSGVSEAAAVNSIANAGNFSFSSSQVNYMDALMNNTMTKTIVLAFNQYHVVSSVGPLGSSYYGSDGGIYFANSTAGYERNMGNPFEGGGLRIIIDWVVGPLTYLANTGAGLKYTSSNLLRDGYWRGINGNYYSMTLTQKGTQGWNFYKNSADIARGSVKWLGRFGNTLGYLSTAYNGYNFVTNPGWESGIETTVGVGSIFFWEIGAIYYPAKLMYKSAEFNASENTKRGLDPFWDLRFMK